MATTRRGIVVEGVDDAETIRECLLRSFDVARANVSDDRSKHFVATRGDVELTIYLARGKPDLPKRTGELANQVQTIPLSEIAVVFDPDSTAETHDLDNLLKQMRRQFGERWRQSAGQSGEHFLRSDDDRDVRISFAAWRLGVHSFACLPEEQNLERVFVQGLLDASLGNEELWAATSTKELMGIVRGHGWKRAFRIWSAALVPDAERAMPKLIQDERYREHVLAAIARTPVYAALQRLLTPTIAAPTSL